jgi:hypothetical protein
MVRIRLSELDNSVKEFLAPAQAGETIVVEDDDGRVQCGVTSYFQASASEKQRAQDALGRLQEKARRAMTQQGITEGAIDRELHD